MKTIRYFILTGFVASIASLSYLAAGSQGVIRECRDPAGHLLYRVRGHEIIAPNNLLIGTVENGEVRDSGNRLLARDGDPGLLYCLTRQ